MDKMMASTNLSGFFKVNLISMFYIDTVTSGIH